jgi:glycine reductase
MISTDTRFNEIEVELVHPGDECRVVKIFDIVEPRTKLDGENFPGLIGGLKTVGNGRTLVLRGTSVVPIDNGGGTRSGIFDMTGPIAKYNLYANLHHVILHCHPKEGISRSDYQDGLRSANLKAAIYLAEAGKGIPPDALETYTLPSLFEMSEDTKHLPRIAYIYQIHTLQQSGGIGEPIFYGDEVMKLLPTVVHPNEILDGALVRGHYGGGQETYSIQNNAIIKELYKRHGKDLCFVGVVVVVATSTTEHRQRSAIMASKLVRSVLGAEGAILTKTGGGAPHADMGWTAEMCEEAGIKTVMIVQDQSNNMTSEGSLLYASAKVDAVVNVGSWTRELKLPPMPKVIGGPLNFKGKPAGEDIEVRITSLIGALNQVGASKLLVREI